jgi:glycerophosphoryl diester phosphodiesterase
LSFDLAKKLGARHVEIDTQLSKDGEIVLCHDETLRAYGHTGRIRDLPYHGSLEHLDMGSHKDPKFSDARMMRLDDLLQEYGRAFRYHVELKSGQAELPAAVLKVISNYKMEDNVVFTSGRPTMLQAAKDLAPDIPRAYLARYADERVLRIAARLEVEQLCPRADLITPELVATWKNVVPMVRAWGVSWLTKDLGQYRWRVEQVVRSGSDGTTIDHPDYLVHSSNIGTDRRAVE